MCTSHTLWEKQSSSSYFFFKKKPLDFLCSETWASVEHLLLPREVIVLSCAGKEHDVSPQGSWEEPRHLHLCQQTPRWNIQKPVEPDRCTPVPIYLTLWLILGIPRPQSWHSVPMAFESYWESFLLCPTPAWSLGIDHGVALGGTHQCELTALSFDLVSNQSHAAGVAPLLLPAACQKFPAGCQQFSCILSN